MIKNLLFILFMTGSVFADSLFVGPSFYYTRGNYSNDNYSNEYSFYNLLQVSRTFTLLQHYDNLTISNTGWQYNQQGLLGGVIADYSPYYFKLNYGNYSGKYKQGQGNSFGSSGNTDYTNVYNADFFYFSNWSYIGASYSFVDVSGSLDFSNHQITARFDKFISLRWFFSVKPAVTITEDGKSLLSAAIKAYWYPTEKFIIKAGGFTGERFYYFDPDLILVYNQNEIQRYLFFSQFEYLPTQQIALIAAYSHSSFSTYNINYLVAGIRAGFWL